MFELTPSLCKPYIVLKVEVTYCCLFSQCLEQSYSRDFQEYVCRAWTTRGICRQSWQETDTQHDFQILINIKYIRGLVIIYSYIRLLSVHVMAVASLDPWSFRENILNA